MSRIKIDDLPVLEDLDETASKGLFGGISDSYRLATDSSTGDTAQTTEELLGNYNFKLEIDG